MSFLFLFFFLSCFRLSKRACESNASVTAYQVRETFGSVAFRHLVFYVSIFFFLLQRLLRVEDLLESHAILPRGESLDKNRLGNCCYLVWLSFRIAQRTDLAETPFSRNCVYSLDLYVMMTTIVCPLSRAMLTLKRGGNFHFFPIKNCSVHHKSFLKKKRKIPQIGEQLKEKFDSATEVEPRTSHSGSRRHLVPRSPTYKPHTDADLVYLDRSPDYCEFDSKTGSLGTHGRPCNKVIRFCLFLSFFFLFF